MFIFGTFCGVIWSMPLVLGIWGFSGGEGQGDGIGEGIGDGAGEMKAMSPTTSVEASFGEIGGVFSAEGGGRACCRTTDGSTLGGVRVYSGFFPERF